MFATAGGNKREQGMRERERGGRRGESEERLEKDAR